MDVEEPVALRGESTSVEESHGSASARLNHGDAAPLLTKAFPTNLGGESVGAITAAGGECAPIKQNIHLVYNIPKAFQDRSGRTTRNEEEYQKLKDELEQLKEDIRRIKGKDDKIEEKARSESFKQQELALNKKIDDLLDKKRKIRILDGMMIQLSFLFSV